MDARSVSFICQASGGERLTGSAEANALRVCTDSREARPGDLFVALAGERFDGHFFIPDAVSKGAVAVMGEPAKLPAELAGCAVIAVGDVRKAYGLLAARYRRDFSIPVIAVAGSNGKTTTKDLVASVLSQKFVTLSSEASFNNDVGVPGTLLRLNSEHQAAVLEAGTNHPGELAPLVRLIAPQYGILTSIGREHLEFFGDLKGVAEEEGWLAELLPAAGKLYLNGDSEWSEPIARRTAAKVVRVGFGEHNDWCATSLRLDKDGAVFRVKGPHSDYSGEYRVNLLGRHQAANALYAIAVSCELGVSPTDVQRGLAACKPQRMRLQLWEHNGVRILNDAYNANEDSMIAALQTLQELPCKGRRVAVLGDMAELGEHSEAAHEAVGRRVAELGVGQLFAVGKMAPSFARGARQAGLNRVLEFGDLEGAAPAVKSFLRAGDLVLLKASRRARLERLAELLKAN